MIFTPQNKVVDVVSIIFDDTTIFQVYATKYLGVHIDYPLNWKTYINYICK